MSMILYHYWRSSASWRVRWALEIKKVPHTKVAINLLAGEEKAPEYLKKNPSGYVPCLDIGNGVLLGESIPIMEWLEETQPGPSILPKSPVDRALARRLAETINSGIQPLQNLDVTRKVSSDKAEQTKWCQFWITKGMTAFEQLIPNSHGPFLFGDQPTIADICLIPQCYATNRFEVDLNLFPKSKKIYEYALTTDACKASTPDKFQPAD